MGALVLGSSLGFFSVPVADNDLWGHLFFGRTILAGTSLPTSNTYSYTAPDHPWINHEILSEIVFAWTFDHLGSAGLIGFKVGLGFLALVLVARTCRRRSNDPIALAAAVVLAASLMSWGYLFRPQIFTFAGLAFLWDRLHAYAAGENVRSAWILVPTFALWANAHGGVLAGVAVLVAFAVLHRPSDPLDRRHLRGAAAASLLALLANPYGVELPAFLVRDVLRDRPIPEWDSIPLLDASNAQFKIAVAIAAIGFTQGRRRIWEVVTLTAAAIATFRHERHLPLFAILAAPHLADTLALALRPVRRRVPALCEGWAARFVAASFIGLAVLQTRAAVRIHRDLGLGILVPPELFPVDATRYLRASGLSGNLALPFGWGEYAIYHLYPDFRVSIDGRYTTAYPDRVIDAAWWFMAGAERWDEIVAGADVALVDRRHATALRIASARGWEPVYSDPVAIVFARNGKAVRASPGGALVPREDRHLFP